MSSNNDKSRQLEILFVVQALIKQCNLNTGEKIDLSWHHGMVGVLPVFRSQDEAERYSDGRFPISVISSAPLDSLDDMK